MKSKGKNVYDPFGEGSGRNLEMVLLRKRQVHPNL